MKQKELLYCIHLSNKFVTIWKILMLLINLTVIEIVINTMFTYPWKNDQKALGWQFTAEVNYPFSRQFSQTEAHTHQSVSWDLKSVVHSLDVYDEINVNQYFYNNTNS